MHRLRDVFDALFPDVLEGIGEPFADVIADRARYANATGLGQYLKPRRDVDAVAVNVITVCDHVAEADPNPGGDAFLLGLLGVAVDHRPLDLDRATHRIDDAGKLHQHAVARGLDDPAPMLPDFRVHELAAMRFQAVEGASSSANSEEII